jgi:hypothetical protein
MAWTTPRTWVAAETVTASIMNTHIRDNLNAIQGGLVSTPGFAELDLLGSGSAPAVSSASHATIYYDTAQAGLFVSLNTGAYSAVGTSPIQNVFIISMWADIIKRM